MNASTIPFCEQCGAANKPQATTCSFCAHPLHTSRMANDAAEHESLLAETLLKGRYRIIKAVGQGGMGKVYRAQDTEMNDRAVAIKEMIVSGLRAWEVIEATDAFKREATLLAALQHPNLPSVFEHFEENGRWYMVMSFIPGETLEEYLKRTNRTKLPLNEVLEIGQQLCTALAYLHSQHPPIIFRDVKPANIMRAPDGQIYLIDFGVARRFKPGQKKDTTPFGSIGYAPPEQFNKAQTTPRADIYALGATLHQLLSGHEPDSAPFHFPPLSPVDLKIPLSLTFFIGKMLEMDAAKRPTNMFIVREQLREISAASAPAPISPTFALPKPARLKRRRILRVALALIVITVCLIGGGVVGNEIGIGTSTMPKPHSAPGPILLAQAPATATAVQRAALPDPYQPEGTLALVDPLDQANAWQEQPVDKYQDSCQYKNNTFQVTATESGNWITCTESVLYKNLAIQVNMTVLQGDCGGIDLQANSSGTNSYEFDICSDGTYDFSLLPSNAPITRIRKDISSTVIKKGAQTNTIALIAYNDTFDLYINGQKVDRISNSPYKSADIGLIGLSKNHATIVGYQDAIIWTLP